MSESIRITRPKESSYDQEQSINLSRTDFSNNHRVLFKDVIAKCKEKFGNQELHVLMSMETHIGVNQMEELTSFSAQEFKVFTQVEFQNYLVRLIFLRSALTPHLGRIERQQEGKRLLLQSLVKYKLA